MADLPRPPSATPAAHDASASGAVDPSGSARDRPRSANASGAIDESGSPDDRPRSANASGAVDASGSPDDRPRSANASGAIDEFGSAEHDAKATEAPGVDDDAASHAGMGDRGSGEATPAAAASTPLPADARLVAFVPTTDLERAHSFYGRLLGLRRTETSPIAYAYDAHGTQLRVTLVDRAAGAPYTVLGWNVTEIQAACEQLAAAGVSFNTYVGLDQDSHGIWTSPSGARVAWFHDPDGNVISLGQPAAGATD